MRITGEDVGRGTFSPRHAKLHNQADGSVYIPLCHVKKNQPRTAVYDSLLSEMKRCLVLNTVIQPHCRKA